MQTRLQLLHEWTRHLQSLLPGVRVTRVRVLALLSLGMLWAESIHLGRIAQALPLTVQDLSTERRLRRWLANRQMPVVGTWQPLLGALLARHGNRDLVLVFDPTPVTDRYTLLVLSLVVHRRSLPVAWHVVPGTEAWRHDTWSYLRRLCQRVDRALPPGACVTLVVDRGLASVAIIDLCQRLGWHYVMRLSVDARQGMHVRVISAADGRDDGDRDRPSIPAWELVPGKGKRWTGTVEAFGRHGWRRAELTIVWPRRYAQPWLLLSDRAAGPDRVAEYRCRTHVEATYADTKTRGFDLEASRITDRNRLNRLMLALVLALWWAHLLGQRVIRSGIRRQFDRPNRRDLSLLRLGKRWMRWLLDHDHLPPLPFRYHVHDACLRCRWAF